MSDKDDDSIGSAAGIPNFLNLMWAEKRALHIKMLEEYEWTPERLAYRADMVAMMDKPTKEDQ